MKNFIDRFAYTLHRPRFFDQVFLAVSTVGGVMGMKQALAQLALLSSGSKKVYRVGVPMPPISMPMLENKAAKKLIKTSKAFYASMCKAKRHQPGFGDFAYFGAFKTMSSFDSYKEVCPADYDYYKDKAAYFYPVKAMRSSIGKMLTGVMRLSLKLIVKDKADKEQTGVSEVK
jgi:multimeric flavodoxin WrbA